MKAPKHSLKGCFMLSSLMKILLATASCSGTLRPRGLNLTQQIVAESTVCRAQSHLCRTDQCLLPWVHTEMSCPSLLLVTLSRTADWSALGSFYLG